MEYSEKLDNNGTTYSKLNDTAPTIEAFYYAFSKHSDDYKKRLYKEYEMMYLNFTIYQVMYDSLIRTKDEFKKANDKGQYSNLIMQMTTTLIEMSNLWWSLLSSTAICEYYQFNPGKPNFNFKKI